MKLKIISPICGNIEYDADTVRLLAPDGYVGIHEGCAPMLVALVESDVVYTQGDKTLSVAITDGFAEVTPHRVNVFADRR